MVTMRDVAHVAGVSPKTVSRVFRDDPHVLPETRERVARAMSELHYTPNMLARTFRDGRLAMAAVAVPDLADPFFASLARAVERVAHTEDHGVVVASLGDDPADEEALVAAMLQRQLSGLIIAPISRDQGYLTPWLTSLPVVFVDREPVGVRADYFIEDDERGARTAVDHLFSQGHRRIAVLGDSTDVVTTRHRLAGYRSALADHGVEVDDDLVLLGDPRQARARLHALAERDPDVTAVFSSNSRTTQEVFPAFQSELAGLALVSFGDFPMAAALQPVVPVVDQDPERLGTVAAQRLFARLNSPRSRFKVRNVLDVHLIRA